MILSQSSHCALIILMELARHYESKGVLLKEVSEEHDIPFETLFPIACRLFEMGILCCQEGHYSDSSWLFLYTNPNDIYVYDIVLFFDGESFPGQFVDSESGKMLPTSRVSRDINMERQHILAFLRKRLKRLSIAYWSEKVYRHTYQSY